jgi:hypothetical protein
VQRAEFIGIDVKSVSEPERLIRGIKAVLADLPEPAEGMAEETESFLTPIRQS